MCKVALLLAFTVSSAVAQSGYPVTLFGSGSKDMMYEFEISQERAEKMPRWSPTGGPPPFAISDAVATAETWIKKRNPEIKQFSLMAVTLAPVGWPESLADRWYYRIEFNPIIGGQRLFGGNFTAVVLFDGTVVEPRVEKRTKVQF